MRTIPTSSQDGGVEHIRFCFPFLKTAVAAEGAGPSEDGSCLWEVLPMAIWLDLYKVGTCIFHRVLIHLAQTRRTGVP